MRVRRPKHWSRCARHEEQGSVVLFLPGVSALVAGLHPDPGEDLRVVLWVGHPDLIVRGRDGVLSRSSSLVLPPQSHGSGPVGPTTPTRFCPRNRGQRPSSRVSLTTKETEEVGLPDPSPPRTFWEGRRTDFGTDLRVDPTLHSCPPVEVRRPRGVSYTVSVRPLSQGPPGYRRSRQDSCQDWKRKGLGRVRVSGGDNTPRSSSGGRDGGCVSLGDVCDPDRGLGLGRGRGVSGGVSGSTQTPIVL